MTGLLPEKDPLYLLGRFEASGILHCIPSPLFLIVRRLLKKAFFSKIWDHPLKC